MSTTIDDIFVSAPDKKSGASASTPGRNLVIIEDDACISRAVSLYLGTKGYTMESFARAAPARDWLARNACDVVITDILMPDSDGLEVIRWCRSYHPAVKIIAISGTDPWGHSHLRVAKLMGASQILQKPFELSALADAVAKLVP